ncbi:MAG: phosphatidylglycerophosphatase A [Planctomycetes bacterium]|nr:phosphatidylglycerophosphatase A [Planctomycetota bacterium]
MKNFILKGLVSAAYTGYFPWIGGTIGTIFAVDIYLICYGFINMPYKEYLISGAGVLFFSIICLLTGKWAEKYYGKKDPKPFVLDEFAGYFLSVFMINLSDMPALSVITSFILFRFFDVLKPFPAKQAERLNGGIGIVTDDLIAGFYANILTRILLSMPWFIKLDPSSYIL